jgi:hypothetical protein
VVIPLDIDIHWITGWYNRKEPCSCVALNIYALNSEDTERGIMPGREIGRK